MKKYIFVTDLDATLLDHETYSWDEAIPALDLLKKNDVPVIFNSSKTLAEIQQLKKEMNNIHPCVAENGSVICWSGSWGEAEMIENPGIAREGIIQILNKLKPDFPFKAFFEYSPAELSEETGLNELQSEKALTRHGSEPVKWLGDDDELLKFKYALAHKNLHLIKGGRFYHVMGMVDKSEVIERLRDVYSAMYKKNVCIVALGDSPNDKLMLEAADIAVVIPSPKSADLILDREDFILAPDFGPKGWNESVLKIYRGE